MTGVRERLIAAGLDLFHSQGYNATGVQQIATAAGVPKGSFYNHFSSKQALATVVLQTYALANPIEMLVDLKPSAAGAVREHFARLRETFEQTGYTRGCLMGNISTELADTEPTVREVLDQLFTGWATLIARAIERAQDDGDIPRRTDAATAAGALLNGWEGALIRSRCAGDAQALDDFRDGVLALIVPGPTTHDRGAHA